MALGNFIIGAGCIYVGIKYKNTFVTIFGILNITVGFILAKMGG